MTNTNTNTNKLKIKQVRLYNGSLTFIVQVQVHISSKSSTDKIGTEGYVSTYALVNWIEDFLLFLYYNGNLSTIICALKNKWHMAS